MRESLCIFAAMLFLSCSAGEEERSGTAAEPAIPLVLVTFEDFPVGTSVPWTLRGISPDSTVSLGMLATDYGDEIPDLVSVLTTDAALDGRLLLLVDTPGIDPSTDRRESMRITTGPDGLPLTVEPEGIREELEGFDWSDPVQRQLAVVRLMSLNLPDLVVVRTRGLDTTSAIEVCRIWMEQTLPGRLRVAFYSPPGGESGRGWIALTGPGIADTDILGMTPLDCLATVRVLAGLPWEPSISNGIPAMAVLTGPPGFLSEGGVN